MAPSARASYGYQWPDERLASGALRRDRLERNPLTWATLERIWREALSGRTQRAIAAGLTADAITTPSGRGTRWDPNVIHYILNNPIYWGKPMALRRQLVPNELAVRAQYRHKSRPVRRAVEEQVPLPDDFAPPVVTPEAAERVHKMATLHKWLATPQNPDPHELLRGIAKCGYCENRLLVARYHRSPDGSGRERTIYKCGLGNRLAGACGHHGIEAHRLDDSVWATVTLYLRNPERIRAEIERMRETGDPSASTVEAIDRQLADVRRRIKNKRAYAETVDDDRERDDVAAEVKALRVQERKLESERAATFAHFADWQATQEGLERILDWCERVSGHLDQFTFAERRETLLTLDAEVWLYKADRIPRVEVELSLPLSGVLPFPGDVDSAGNGVIVGSTSRR